MARPIVLTTDFGHSDNYVGIMKGVIRKISPFADILDLNHNINQGDIANASYNIETAYNYFPDYSVFLCVIDPGVGSERRAIAIETENHFFVSPDNGVLSFILKNENIKSCVELNKSDYFLKEVSDTFHGRDIFAPIAAHISLKKELHELGTPINHESLIRLENTAHKSEEVIHGKIRQSDYFGNLITDIPADWLEKKKKN
jgi:S-adenosylmethionine hydrolase